MMYAFCKSYDITEAEILFILFDILLLLIIMAFKLYQMYLFICHFGDIIC